MNLFNLFATLTLDNSDYEKKLDKSQKSAGSFSSKVGTSFKTGARAVAGFVTGVAAVGAAIGGLVLKMVDAGSEIDDNAQKIGFSTEAYQYWALVMQRIGTDASTLSLAIRNMTTFTQNLADGQGEALLTLQKLGIGYEEFMAMTPEEQFYTLIDALQGMTDETEKTQIAQDVFGNRVYQELLPLLGMEQGSLEDLRNEFESLGLIMSDDMVKSIAAVGDKLDNLGNLFKVMGLNIAVDFLPEINNILDAFTALVTGSSSVEDAMQMIADSFVSVIKKIVAAAPNIIDAAGDLILNVLVGILDVLADPEVLKALLNVVMSLLNKAIEIIPTLINSLLNLATALILAFLDLDWNNLIRTILDALLEIAAKVIPNLITSIAAILEALIETLVTVIPQAMADLATFASELIKTLMNVFIELDWGNFLASVINAVMDLQYKILPNALVNMLFSVFETVFDLFFTKDGRQLFFDFGKSLAESLINGLISVVENGVNLLIDAINGILGGISSAWTWAGIPAIPNIPKVTIPRVNFAEGGMFPDSKGTIYALAGEDGAEIVARGARGTGVANIEQIADAQYMAMRDYDLRGAIQEAAVAIVNGIVDGLSDTDEGNGNMPIIVQIGDKNFNGYIVNAVNSTLRAQGRKSLNTVTAYGGK